MSSTWHSSAICGAGVAGQARQFGVEEADVEGGVVDDQLGAGDELQELVGDLGEARLVREVLRATCRAPRARRRRCRVRD